MIYCPRVARIDITCEATFDKTLFPLKPQDQRVYGIYDYQAVNQLSADTFRTGTDADISGADKKIQMPLPTNPPQSTNVEIRSSKHLLIADMLAHQIPMLPVHVY